MTRWATMAILLALLPLTSAQAQPAAVAMTAQGRLAGVSKDGVERYLGVPFAAPPVGELRWRAPRPVQPWTGIRDATAPSPVCIQDSVSNPLTAGYAPRQSEDCLYLNIFRPTGKMQRALPVMVWIHGGAFIMGSGGMPDYDGSALARRGAVIITINYRLGRFGSFAHPALAAEQKGQPLANYGMMDQIAALRWVRSNAAALGGDPHNVTIMGESAGASSVNFLMTSPAARDLFAKAISESGGASTGLMSLAAAEQSGEHWAAGKGAHDAAGLRALPASVVLDAPVRAPIFPVIDGRIVLGPTADMFATDGVARVPYLVGANDHEESLMRWLPGAGPQLLAKLGAKAKPLVALYTAPGETRETAIAHLWGENAMTIPARRRALQQAARGAPVWLYRFGYVPEALRTVLPGAGHGDETQFVFDVPAPAARARWAAADAAMAQAVGDYWVAFARTGNPNHAGAAPWLPVRRGSVPFLSFGANAIHAVRDSSYRQDMLEAATAN